MVGTRKGCYVGIIPASSRDGGSLFSTPAEVLRVYLSTSAFPWAASAQMTKMSSVMIMSDQNG